MLQTHVGTAAGASPLSGTIAEYVWLLPILPLIGFVINGLLSLFTAYRAGPTDPSAGHGDGDHGDAHASQHDDHHTVTRHRFAGVVTIVGPLVLLASFVLAVAIYLAMPAEMPAPFVKTFFSWMPVGSELPLRWAFQLDQLSMVMVLVITGVGTLIHIFSVGYMQDDPGYPRYFAYLNLFVAFMLVLVLGASYPVLFVGWE
ncbi:MAG: hypothetical protein IRY91_03180, partial [Gemmatimonadaceae bacterium]|nr:hypothetical protein [Gemmatimonadaceae bacterium]